MPLPYLERKGRVTLGSWAKKEEEELKDVVVCGVGGAGL
jgi:hypothetical protein